VGGGEERDVDVGARHRIGKAPRVLDIAACDLLQAHVVAGEGLGEHRHRVDCEVARRNNVPEPATSPAWLGGEPGGLLALPG
jgi:hypothetical protein